MSKIYVLSEIIWLYNDEYFYNEENAGVPKYAFKSLKSALKKHKELSVELARRQPLLLYIGQSGIRGGKDLQEALYGYEIIVDRFMDTAIEIENNGTDDQVFEFLKINNLNFYTVNEVEIYTEKSKARSNK